MCTWQCGVHEAALAGGKQAAAAAAASTGDRVGTLHTTSEPQHACRVAQGRCVTPKSCRQQLQPAIQHAPPTVEHHHARPAHAASQCAPGQAGPPPPPHRPAAPRGAGPWLPSPGRTWWVVVRLQSACQAWRTVVARRRRLAAAARRRRLPVLAWARPAPPAQSTLCRWGAAKGLDGSRGARQAPAEALPPHRCLGRAAGRCCPCRTRRQPHR